MINRGDIKLAIDMVVNAQDDNLFGGEAEYVINTLEDCGNEIAKLREQVAAQAAVIEAIKRGMCNLDPVIQWLINGCDVSEAVRELQIYNHLKDKALAIPTDSTQILDEVRRAERERVAEFILRTDLGNIPKEWQGFAADGLFKYAEAIRAME